MTTGGEPTATGEVKTAFAVSSRDGRRGHHRAHAVGPPGLSRTCEEKYRAEKQQIVRAAYELIQRDGSKETSVHDVLHAAGLSTRRVLPALPLEGRARARDVPC